MNSKKFSRDELGVQLNLKLVESLRSSEEKYRRLVDNLNHIVFQLNSSGHFVFLNAAWENTTGIKVEEALNRSWIDYIDSADQANSEQHFLHALQPGKTCRFECQLVAVNGHRLTVQACLSPLTEINDVDGVIGTFFDITEHKQTLRLISDSQSRLAWALQGADDGYWDWNLETNYVFYSPRWKTMLGFTPDHPLPPHLDTWGELVHPDDKNPTLTIARQYLDGEIDKFEIEFRMRHANGNWIDILSRASLALDDYGQPVQPKRLIGTHVDISDRKQVELQLQLLKTALESSANSVLITSTDAKIEWANPAFTELTGYSKQEFLGKTPKQLVYSGVHDKAFIQVMWNTILGNKVWQGDLTNKHKDGSLFDEHMTITPVTDESERIHHFIAIKENITQRKASEREIHSLAFYDPLTKLPNRRLLTDRLNQELQNKHGPDYAALLFIDLDNFKKLNDTHGHDYGDLLLTEVSRRLNQCVRNSDTVARLGGDEFVVMLTQLGKHENKALAITRRIGNKILAMMNHTYTLSNIEHRSSSSIGVCMFSEQNDKAEEILKRADTAMYEAKSGGRNALRFFDPSMQLNLAQHVQLEKDLWNAIEQKQFRLFYQVQVDSQAKIQGAEALLRWQHPCKSIITPDQFLESAESMGLISKIDDWVIDTGLQQLQHWQSCEKTKKLSLSLNVSAMHFQKPDFIAKLKQKINHAGVKSSGLILELTESSLIENIDNTIYTIKELGEMGVRFSMDDFGTGYSSLSYLKRFKISELKIDRMFVRDLPNDTDDRILVKTIINMGLSLDLKVTAEGVETAEQFELLKQYQCTKFQGYLFGKPIPITEFDSFLHTRT